DVVRRSVVVENELGRGAVAGLYPVAVVERNAHLGVMPVAVRRLLKLDVAFDGDELRVSVAGIAAAYGRAADRLRLHCGALRVGVFCGAEERVRFLEFLLRAIELVAPAREFFWSGA